MKYYRQGDECTFTSDMREYDLLKAFAKLLTENSPNHNTYYVKDVYLDAGQDWMWTTICNKEQGYQALSPREWFEIVNEEKPQKDIMNDTFADKFCPDRLRG